MHKTPQSFLAKARSWIAHHKLSGPQAFLRFVMFSFVQRLNDNSDEFVFKGGNLLWLYIKTPRTTVDVDFVTKSLNDHQNVRSRLEELAHRSNADINFTIISF